jgi:hypothetical protein
MRCGEARQTKSHIGMIPTLRLCVQLRPFVDQRLGFRVPALEAADVAEIDQRLREREGVPYRSQRLGGFG